MIPRPARVSIAATFVVVASALAYSQAPKPSTAQTPGCEAPVWGKEVQEFTRRIDAYVALRTRLEAGLPLGAAARDASEAGAARQTLAERIRAARAQARQGDLLIPELSVQILKSLRREINAHTWKVIMDDNPGEFPSQVNDAYRIGSPLSTMPPNVLAGLPKLPQGLEYRFVERHLILLDTPSGIILDRIASAIRPSDVERGCR
jgi:hypothetical protein